MSRLEINFLNHKFKNPIITSSGCFGFGTEYEDYFDPNILGGIGIKGLTLQPRTGNIGTRVTETPAGMLNCVGLENSGIEAFKKEILPTLKDKLINTHIVANINGNTLEEYVELAKQVNNIKEIGLVELNLSCPNVKCGGMAFGVDPDAVGTITKAVKKVLNKPLIVKLSPNVTDIVKIAIAAEKNGADAISVINTVLGMAIDTKTQKPVLCNTFGGLSGACVKPIALRVIYQIYPHISIPIIGMGGICQPSDAIEFMMAGASIVSIGSGIFNNPLLPVEMIEYLENYCKEHKLKNISEIVGVAHGNQK